MSRITHFVQYGRRRFTHRRDKKGQQNMHLTELNQPKLISEYLEGLAY